MRPFSPKHEGLKKTCTTDACTLRVKPPSTRKSHPVPVVVVYVRARARVCVSACVYTYLNSTCIFNFHDIKLTRHLYDGKREHHITTYPGWRHVTELKFHPNRKYDAGLMI
jgi:hypothetical protein